MSEADKANMTMVVAALRHTARRSTNIQRREKNYSGADWKWVQMHTYIDNPYEAATDTTIKVNLFCISIVKGIS